MADENITPQEPDDLRERGDQDCVCNLRDVLKHLTDSPPPTELLVSLRHFCNERLKERGEDTLVAVDEERRYLGNEANFEILLLADVLQKQITERDTHGVIGPIARGILARIKTLQGIVHDAAFCEEEMQDELTSLEHKLNGPWAA